MESVKVRPEISLLIQALHTGHPDRVGCKIVVFIQRLSVRFSDLIIDRLFLARNWRKWI